jgi:hypothetical protein
MNLCEKTKEIVIEIFFQDNIDVYVSSWNPVIKVKVSEKTKTHQNVSTSHRQQLYKQGNVYLIN